MAIKYQPQEGIKYMTHGLKKHLIELSDILYLECDDHLITIHLINQTQIFEIFSLCQFETYYGCYGFIRISNNMLINLKYATGIIEKNGQKYLFLGQIELKISRRKRRNITNYNEI